MNGFQAGKALKSVRTCHTREGGAEIRMLAWISCCAIGNQPLQRFMKWRYRGRNKQERSGMRVKVESARRQLGTALALYLDYHDPASVHCLAGRACEVLDFYVKKVGKEPVVPPI